MLHCKGFVPGFYLVLYVFPVCFVPICLWPAFILEHNTYITQAGRSQQIESSPEKNDVPNGIGTEIDKLNLCYTSTSTNHSKEMCNEKKELVI